MEAGTEADDVTDDLRPHPDVSWRRLDDEVVIVHLRTNQIYRLNRTAARFWELIAQGADRATAERVLSEEFDIEDDELRRATRSLVTELSNEGLLAGSARARRLAIWFAGVAAYRRELAAPGSKNLSDAPDPDEPHRFPTLPLLHRCLPLHLSSKPSLTG
jgi:hypothetical protein